MNGLSDAEKAVVDNLSPAQLRYAYRKFEMECDLDDAKRQWKDYQEINDELFESMTEEEIENLIEEDEFEWLADRFRDKQDCNIDDNTLWQLIIDDFMIDKGVKQIDQNEQIKNNLLMR